MMKQKLILWLAAIVITFLAGYLNSATGKYYPVSGTIGIEGKKVSYVLEKEYSGKEPYKVLVRTDVENINGLVQWRLAGADSWNEIEMYFDNSVLQAELPAFKPLTTIEYRIKILGGENVYLLPGKNPVTLKIFGNVPSIISALYFITLFGGLLFSTRTGLEYFSENGRTRLLTIITIIFFFLYTLAVHPVKTTFELNILNNRVPAINELFDVQSILFLCLWIAGMWSAFKSNKQKLILLIISILTLLTFILIRF